MQAGDGLKPKKSVSSTRDQSRWLPRAEAQSHVKAPCKAGTRRSASRTDSVNDPGAVPASQARASPYPPPRYLNCTSEQVRNHSRCWGWRHRLPLGSPAGRGRRELLLPHGPDPPRTAFQLVLRLDSDAFTVQPPQVAPASRSKPAPNPRSVSPSMREEEFLGVDQGPHQILVALTEPFPDASAGEMTQADVPLFLGRIS
jgi:hypothetical protein